jgi:hypothetical protein
MSPGMTEYAKRRDYEPDIEQKKTENLANFFIEKYVLISQMLKEGHMPLSPTARTEALDQFNFAANNAMFSQGFGRKVRRRAT